MPPRLRPATKADLDSLYALHREVMQGPVLQTLGAWDDDWQFAQFREAFRPRHCRIIVLDGQDVGVCAYERRSDDYFLRLLEVLPQYQGRGIGSLILRRLLARAQREGRPITLFAVRTDGARRFYERLGFSVIGETATHYLMQANPGR